MIRPECYTSGLLEKIPYALFVYFKLATFVPAAIGLYAIFHHGASFGWAIGYLMVFFIHASIVFRLKCTHCTYYLAPGKTVKCMWLWGIPKIFKKNPHPEAAFNKVYVPLSVSVVAFFPLYWLLNNMFLLVLYISSLSVLVLSLFLFACSKCTYFECRNNRVPSKLKSTYLANQTINKNSQV